MFKRIALAASLVATFSLGATALGLAGNGGGSNNASSSSISLVIVSSSSASTSTEATAFTSGAHWGDIVTFDVSTAASSPYITLNCYQNGAWVYTMSAGAWPEAPGTHYFTLSSSAWKSGAANCSADLHSSASNGKKNSLAVLDFQVAA